MFDPNTRYFTAWHPERRTYLAAAGETTVKSEARLLVESELAGLEHDGFLFEYAGCKREVQVPSRRSHVVICTRK